VGGGRESGGIARRWGRIVVPADVIVNWIAVRPLKATEGYDAYVVKSLAIARPGSRYCSRVARVWNGEFASRQVSQSETTEL
jgi:hypothetical protein